MVRVCHFTVGHDMYDQRVFYKQCRSLANHGYETHLIVPHGHSHVRDGVTIHAVSASPVGRLARMATMSVRVFAQALGVRAQVYHFHDPELLPCALILRLLGKTVIFDSHEDTVADILDKAWIPRSMRNVVSTAFGWVQRICARACDAVIVVSPHIAPRFEAFQPNVVVVTNYPVLADCESRSAQPTEVPANQLPEICFVGRVCDETSQEQVLRALEMVPGVRYSTAGYAEEDYLSRLKSLPAGDRFSYIGPIEHEQNAAFLRGKLAGLQLTKKIANYGGNTGSLGNTKLFNYMNHGLPIICSDFLLWRDAVEGQNCGICVDPSDPRRIAAAIQYLLTHPADAAQKGANGQRAARETFNWKTQEHTLLQLYRSLTEPRPAVDLPKQTAA